MAKPYRIVFSNFSSGIDIEYTRSRRTICVGAWYDSFVGIEGGCMSLAEFLHELHIPKAHLLQAIEENS